LNDTQFEAINSKLDVIVKLLALEAVKGKPLKEQVQILSALELQPKQVADMLGKTPHHISVILHEIRKEAAKTALAEPIVNPADNQS
jgi:hypothetical protein